MHIVLFGPEGSGKGTQAKLLAGKLGLGVLTSGDLVREAAAKDEGAIGAACRQALQTGTYVGDADMFTLWTLRLAREDAKKGWIMDGFPRNHAQAVFLDEQVGQQGYRVDHVFYLDLPQDESLRRLIARGRPLHPGSTELHDSPQRINKRLATYHAGAAELLSYWRDRGVLTRIDANQSVEAVHKAILSHVV